MTPRVTEPSTSIAPFDIERTSTNAEAAIVRIAPASTSMEMSEETSSNFSDIAAELSDTELQR